jgi:hypothetical protein
MGLISIGTVTKLVKNNKQSVKVNLNVVSEFEQSSIIKKKKREKVEISDTNTGISESVDDIIFKENEVINIPKKLDNLSDNLLGENFYLYGTVESSNLLSSLLYILHKDFKFKSSNDQLKFSKQLNINLTNDLPSHFKSKKYSQKQFTLKSMTEDLEGNNFSQSIIHYLSNYYDINLLVFDYYNMKYMSGLDYDEEKNNVIIVKYKTHYIPIIHIFGEFPDNLIYKSFVNKLKISESTLKEVDEPQVMLKVKDIDESEPPKLKLKSIRSYKVSELKDLAKEHNIDLTKDNKNKTKQQLYDDLKSI